MKPSVTYDGHSVVKVTRPCCCSTDNSTHEVGCLRGINEKRTAAFDVMARALEACVSDDNATAFDDGRVAGGAYRRLRAINEIARAALAKARGETVTA